jgi:acetate---CoA ligase (ADP-forming)
VLEKQQKPVIFYSYTLPSDFARRELAKSGVVVLSGLTHVGVAMRRSLDYGKFKLQREGDIAVLPARDLSVHLSRDFSEADSKALLHDAGIAVPDEVLVTDRSALDAAIARVGFPLVMKIQSVDIAHKSNVGGVRINVGTKGEAFSAYRDILESVQKHLPDARIQGVLVSPMARKGIEIIVGALVDKAETFGPIR